MVADHILLGCGLGSLHPEVLLELQLWCATFIIKLDRRIRWSIHPLINVRRKPAIVALSSMSQQQSHNR
eukprot:11076715-Prorocentrum_lima.AAC.1